MPMWRCPNCGTPQPEAARCWVCRRSSTTCSTCRHFRTSLAAAVGYCGLDRRRAPLRGTEHRGCWQAAAVVAQAGAEDGQATAVGTGPGSSATAIAVDPTVARLRPASPHGPPTSGGPGVLEGFVPVELAGRGPRTLRPIDRAPLPAPVVETAESWVDRETLFGDL